MTQATSELCFSLQGDGHCRELALPPKQHCDTGGAGGRQGGAVWTC